MASKIGIWNMALGHLGVGKEVAAADERSAEASACRRYWEQVVDEALGDYPWTFTRKFAALGLVEEDPTDEWAYSYRVPSDCLRVRRVMSDARQDTADTAIPFLIGQDDTGALLYTDQADAEVEYTYRVEDVSRFPADFVAALSLLLAVYIAPRVTAGDQFGLRKDAAQLYQRAIGKAHVNDAMHGRPDQEPMSEFERARQ